MFKSQLEKIGIRPRQAALQNPLIKTGPKDSKTSVIKIAADPRKVRKGLWFVTSNATNQNAVIIPKKDITFENRR